MEEEIKEIKALTTKVRILAFILRKSKLWPNPSLRQTLKNFIQWRPSKKWVFQELSVPNVATTTGGKVKNKTPVVIQSKVVSLF